MTYQMTKPEIVETFLPLIEPLISGMVIVSRGVGGNLESSHVSLLYRGTRLNADSVQFQRVVDDVVVYFQGKTLYTTEQVRSRLEQVFDKD